MGVQWVGGKIESRLDAGTTESPSSALSLELPADGHLSGSLANVPVRQGNVRSNVPTCTFPGSQPARALQSPRARASFRWHGRIIGFEVASLGCPRLMLSVALQMRYKAPRNLPCHHEGQKSVQTVGPAEMGGSAGWASSHSRGRLLELGRSVPKLAVAFPVMGRGTKGASSRQSTGGGNGHELSGLSGLHTEREDHPRSPGRERLLRLLRLPACRRVGPVGAERRETKKPPAGLRLSDEHGRCMVRYPTYPRADDPGGIVSPRHPVRTRSGG